MTISRPAALVRTAILEDSPTECLELDDGLFDEMAYVTPQPDPTLFVARIEQRDPVGCQYSIVPSARAFWLPELIVSRALSRRGGAWCRCRSCI
jgi:hypothetical protein